VSEDCFAGFSSCSQAYFSFLIGPFFGAVLLLSQFTDLFLVCQRIRFPPLFQTLLLVCCFFPFFPSDLDILSLSFSAVLRADGPPLLADAFFSRHFYFFPVGGWTSSFLPRSEVVFPFLLPLFSLRFFFVLALSLFFVFSYLFLLFKIFLFQEFLSFLFQISLIWIKDLFFDP